MISRMVGHCLPVYGFVAARDDHDSLRNYVFNLPREKAFYLSPLSSSTLDGFPRVPLNRFLLPSFAYVC